VPPISELGPDALFEPMTLDVFTERLHKKKTEIKALLLDQVLPTYLYRFPDIIFCLLNLFIYDQDIIIILLYIYILFRCFYIGILTFYAGSVVFLNAKPFILQISLRLLHLSLLVVSPCIRI
jgi:hypothetical protein